MSASSNARPTPVSTNISFGDSSVDRRGNLLDRRKSGSERRNGDRLEADNNPRRDPECRGRRNAD